MQEKRTEIKRCGQAPSHDSRGGNALEEQGAFLGKGEKGGVSGHF